MDITMSTNALWGVKHISSLLCKLQENNMKWINAKYCDRFVHVLWKDGSVVHVYISKEKCRWYEEKMKTALDKMTRR